MRAAGGSGRTYQRGPRSAAQAASSVELPLGPGDVAARARRGLVAHQHAAEPVRLEQQRPGGPPGDRPQRRRLDPEPLDGLGGRVEERVALGRQAAPQRRQGRARRAVQRGQHRRQPALQLAGRSGRPQPPAEPAGPFGDRRLGDLVELHSRRRAARQQVVDQPVGGGPAAGQELAQRAVQAGQPHDRAGLRVGALGEQDHRVDGGVGEPGLGARLDDRQQPEAGRQEALQRLAVGRVEPGAAGDHPEAAALAEARGGAGQHAGVDVRPATEAQAGPGPLDRGGDRAAAGRVAGAAELEVRRVRDQRVHRAELAGREGVGAADLGGMAGQGLPGQRCGGRVELQAQQASAAAERRQPLGGPHQERAGPAGRVEHARPGAAHAGSHDQVGDRRRRVVLPEPAALRRRERPVCRVGEHGPGG